MLVVQAFKYRINPSKAQLPILCSNLGGGRFAYNHLLSLVKANHGQINIEKKTPEGQVTPYQRTDQISLMYLWHETKDEAAGEWRLENSSL